MIPSISQPFQERTLWYGGYQWNVRKYVLYRDLDKADFELERWDDQLGRLVKREITGDKELFHQMQIPLINCKKCHQPVSMDFHDEVECLLNSIHLS